MNQHYFDVPFAFAGDVTAIPDPLQVGGTVSMTEGWNFNYQRDLSTDPAALPIDRSTTNWLLLQISTALQALQQAGVPEFILASQNGGTAYPYGQGAPVLWSASGSAPFGKYVSLTAGNTNTPSVGDPQGLTTGWQLVVDPIATAAQASAGTNDASIMTPLKVAQQTALRALLAGSSSQVFNVATATAASHAVPLLQAQSLIASSGVPVGTATNLKCDNVTAGVTLTYTADEIVVGTALGGTKYVLSNFNQTINNTVLGIGGRDVGALGAAGTWYAIYAAYNPTTQAQGIFMQAEPSGGATTVYGGANLPAGYTATALIGMWVVDSSAHFIVMTQKSRRVKYVPVGLASGAGTVSALTSINMAATVPKVAKFYSGAMSITVSSGGFGNVQLYNQTQTGATSVQNAGPGLSTNYNDMPIDTPQTTWFTAVPTSGTISQYNIVINGFDF